MHCQLRWVFWPIWAYLTSKKDKNDICNFPLSSILNDMIIQKYQKNYKIDSDCVDGLIYTHDVVKLQLFKTWIVINTNLLIFIYKADMLIKHICSKIYDIKNNFFNQGFIHNISGGYQKSLRFSTIHHYFYCYVMKLGFIANTFLTSH